MSAPEPPAAWLEPLASALDRHDRRGGFLLLLPEYRPDLVRIAAEALGLAFLDFRAAVMAPLGWQASGLPLAALDERIAAETTRGPVLVHNAEALLAAKPIAERRAWLLDFLGRDWPTVAVIPLAVLTGEVPKGHDRVVGLAELPASSLLMRLWSSRR